jgi:hypothetical protein
MHEKMERTLNMTTNVLVIGSTHFAEATIQTDDSPEKTKEKEALRNRFFSACRALGRALAETECSVIIGSQSPNTADRYVVDGAASEEGITRVMVIRPETDPEPYTKEAIRWRERLEFIHKTVKGSWDDVRIPQLEAADAVILAAGGTGTRLAGYMAIVHEKPVFPISTFGGAAAALWKDKNGFSVKAERLLKEIQRVPFDGSDEAAAGFIRMVIAQTPK